MANQLQKILKRGYLRAGVSLGINGLSTYDKETNKWEGFDVDTARAVSAAIFHDADAVEFIPLQSAERFTSLHDQTVDLGVFNATISFSREVENDVTFMEPFLYDGEAFMVRKDLIESNGCIENFKSRVVSVIRGSTTYQNLEIFFSINNMSYDVVMSDSPDEALEMYENGKCNIHCLDRILLSGERLRLSEPNAHSILPDAISKEAMSPVVANKDPAWVMLVKWVLRSLIEAEELGLSKENINEMGKILVGYKKSFLNPNTNLCNKLGLQANFTHEIIKNVGNYADIFNRNLGASSPLGLNRQENKLRSNGGLLFSPLFL